MHPLSRSERNIGPLSLSLSTVHLQKPKLLKRPKPDGVTLVLP